MALYLIVANQTIGGEQLTAKLDELATTGPCAFQFLVPVTDTEGAHQWDYPPIDRLIPDAHQIARVLAEARLEHQLARLRRSGIEAIGQVVDDAVPVDRAQELLHERRFDGVVVSTLPRRLSRWLIRDLPHRIASVANIPVTHVEGNAGPSL
jgi:hypothetical protein